MSDNNTLPLKPETPAVLSPEESSSRPLLTYIAIGVVIVVVVALIFYAYTSFSSGDQEVEEKTPEKDTTITGFNLRDAIQRLQTIQSRVMNSLSDISNI